MQSALGALFGAALSVGGRHAHISCPRAPNEMSAIPPAAPAPTPVLTPEAIVNARLRDLLRNDGRPPPVTDVLHLAQFTDEARRLLERPINPQLAALLGTPPAGDMEWMDAALREDREERRNPQPEIDSRLSSVRFELLRHDFERSLAK